MTGTSTRALADLQINPIGLGGNVFGWTADEAVSFDVLDAYLDAGGNLVDTADGYSYWAPGNSGGESEAVIGNWLSSRPVRDRIVLATKVSTKPDRPGLSAGNVRLALEESLSRLRTEAIDIYYAHFDDESTPLEETVLSPPSKRPDAPARSDMWDCLTTRPSASGSGSLLPIPRAAPGPSSCSPITTSSIATMSKARAAGDRLLPSSAWG